MYNNNVNMYLAMRIDRSDKYHTYTNLCEDGRMIYYKKFFDLMKEQGKTQTHIREQKIVGQETLRKLRNGTGILEEYDYKTPGTDKVGKRTRENSIDTKTIESLCKWLHCQPGDIMEVIPNTWENADRLCEILKCDREELSKRVPMENEE